MDYLQSGMLIDEKYLLLEKISEGGGGVVWRVNKADQSQDIALKLLKFSPLSKSKERITAKFKKEFELFKKLSHPNIAKIYDFGYDQTNDLYYFTSELLLGGDLRNLERTDIFNIENILLQSLRALEYLRHFGIFHLDIKPQNLLLRSSSIARSASDEPIQSEYTAELALIDFGLAGFHPPERPGGTPNYMSPEVVVSRFRSQGKEQELPAEYQTKSNILGMPGHHSDLYSLGVTFYNVLTDKLPFAVYKRTGHFDLNAIMLKHLEVKSVPPPSHFNPEVPSYLDDIILRLMERNPQDRYQSALLASQALCFRSPNQLEPETKETISALLPEDGALIGRHQQRQILEDYLLKLSQKQELDTKFICLYGQSGQGSTRLLRSLIPQAQQLELKVIEELAKLPEQIKRPTLILADDPEEVPELKDMNNCLMVFSAKTDDVDLDALPNVLKVELNNFTQAEVGEYAVHMLGGNPPEHLIEELYRTTYGNPQFLTDIFKQMIERGELFSYFTGRPETDALSTLGFSFSHLNPPASLAGYLEEIIRALPESEQVLLQCMACCLQPVAESDITWCYPECTNAFANLISAGFIKKEHNCAAISNPLLSKVIKKITPSESLTKIHARIVQFIQERKNKDEHQFDLNYHLAFGATRQLNVQAVEKFIAQVVEHVHPSHAASLLLELSNVLSDKEYELRKKCLVRAGKALARVGRFEEAQTVYEDIRILTQDPQQKIIMDMRADECLGLLALRRRFLKQASQYFQKAISKMSQVIDPCLVVVVQHQRLKNSLAGLLLRNGKYEQAAQVFLENSKQLKHLPVQVNMRLHNNELSEAYILLKKYDEAIEVANRDLRKARAINNLEFETNQLRLLGNAFRLKGDFEQAQTYYEEGLDLCQRHNFFEYQLRIQNSLANLFLDKGMWQEAINQYQPALDLCLRLEGKASSVDMMANLGYAFNKLEQYDDTIEYLELAIDFAKGPEAESSVQIRKRIPYIYVELGHACSEKGKLVKAEHYLNLAYNSEQYHLFAPVTKYNLHGTLIEIDLAKGEAQKALAGLPRLQQLIKDLPAAKTHFDELTEKIRQVL